MSETCSTHWNTSNADRILVGKRQCKRPIGSCRRGLENYVTHSVRGRGFEGVDWIQLAQDEV